jgi:putative nucleotidyltransferase with HDIG domain
MSALPLPQRVRALPGHEEPQARPDRPRHLVLVRDAGNRPPRLDNGSLRAVRRLGELMESSDRYTFGHCERVAEYAVAVARILTLGETQITTVRLGAYLHDLGKVRVPSAILNKPGRLDPEEMALMREHPSRGVELLSTVTLPWEIQPMVRWHHERFDGSGYPDGLGGEEIPVPAQIIGIADTFDALTSTRSYRRAATADRALNEMWVERRLWHPEVFAAFLTSVATRQAQSRISPWRRSMATVESIGSA